MHRQKATHLESIAFRCEILHLLLQSLKLGTRRFQLLFQVPFLGCQGLERSFRIQLLLVAILQAINRW